MAAGINDKLRKYKSLFSTTLSGGIGTGTGDTITPSTVTGLPTDTAITLTFDRVDSSAVATPTKLERIRGIVSGGNFTSYVRAKDGTTEQAHSGGAVIEMVWNADDWNDMVDWGLVEHNQDGTHGAITATSIDIGSTIAVTGVLDEDTMSSNSAVKLATQQSIKAYVDSVVGTAFWTTVPGTPTRVSDTQFTITDTSNANLYDLIFKKGVILKWDESGTFQTAMVISSSYSSNAVTINIVGDSLTAGFSSMKYAIPMAKKERFMIAGTLPSSATTDLSHTWYPEHGVYILSADLRLKTAGDSTGSTVVDINVSGSTKFTTKPTITTTDTSDLDNVADNPSTAVSQYAPVTIDVDSVTATAPSEGYVDVYYYPVSWRYRS